MKSLPLPARLYVGAVIVFGGALFAARVPLDEFVQPALFVSLVGLAALAASFRLPLPVPARGASFSVAAAVHFVSLLLLGPNPTLIVAVTTGWSQSAVRTRGTTPAYRTFFNMMALVLTVLAAGAAYRWLGGGPGRPWIADGLALSGAASVYFFVNTLLVAGATALGSRRRLWTTWRTHFLWSAPGCYLSAMVAGVAAPIIDRSGYWPILLVAAPLVLTHRVYRLYLDRLEDAHRYGRDIADLHLATIEALAHAIDAKDHASHSHIRRLQLFAAELARALDLGDFEVHGVRTAALLHDIGQLAVPDHILAKPGPLTHEEFQKVRTHPEVGAEIVAHVPFPYPVAPLILAHHERWDGQGYPLGLKGEDIPLGARILSVVDYYDALTSDRPYHRPMPHEAAIRLLEQEAGRALDPVVVGRFLEILPGLLQRTDQAAGAAAARRAAPPASVTRTVFDDIAVAHREIYTLYEIAHAMGASLSVPETMEIVASKLSKVIPYSCCALFLQDDGTELLRCRFATGVDAGVIQQLVVRPGGGAIGWVARTRRPLVNARPRLDLEAAELGSVSTDLRAAIICPLVRHDRLLGAIALYDVLPDRYTDDHGRLLARVGEQVAGVVYNSIVFEQTQADSLTDPLTGLPNMRFLFLHASREVARAARLNSEAALLVLDLDRFKEINDTHGHHVGDRALCAVAAVLREAVRPYDTCARYAGDEFVIVLSGCGRDEAERKLRELRAAVTDIRFEAEPGCALPLGISGGAAIFPHDGRTYEALLAAADSRMYRDKVDRRHTHAGSYADADPVLVGEAAAGAAPGPAPVSVP